MSTTMKTGRKVRNTVFRKLRTKSYKYVSQYYCFNPTLSET